MYSAKRFLSHLILSRQFHSHANLAQDFSQSHCRLKTFPICNSYTTGSYSYKVVYAVLITIVVLTYQFASEGPDSLRLAQSLILQGIQQLRGQNFAIF